MKRLAAVLLLALISSCASTPPAQDAIPSEYMIRGVHNSYVNFTFTISPVAEGEIVYVEVWYQGARILDGKILEINSGVARVVSQGHFSWRAADWVEIRLVTKKKELHRFWIGDPDPGAEKEFHGIKNAL